MYTWQNGKINVSNSYGKRLDIRGMILATGGGGSILKDIKTNLTILFCMYISRINTQIIIIHKKI